MCYRETYINFANAYIGLMFVLINITFSLAILWSNCIIICPLSLYGASCHHTLYILQWSRFFCLVICAN